MYLCSSYCGLRNHQKQNPSHAVLATLRITPFNLEELSVRSPTLVKPLPGRDSIAAMPDSKNVLQLNP